MEAQDLQAMLQRLLQLDDSSLVQLIGNVLRNKVHLSPGIVKLACPDLTYAPAAALTERRSTGIMQQVSAQGALIACPEMHSIFGCDVRVARSQLGGFAEGQLVNFAVLLTEDTLPQAFDLQSSDGIGAGTAVTAATAAPFGIDGRGGTGGMSGMSGMGGMGGVAVGGMAAGGMANLAPGGMGSLGELDLGMSGCMGGSLGGMAYSTGGSMSSHMASMSSQMASMANPSALSSDAGGTEIGTFFGVVRSLDEKGYGFITSDQLKTMGISEDAFCSKNFLGAFQPGQEVSFACYLDARTGRPRAKDVNAATGQVGVQSGFSFQAQRGDQAVLGTYIGFIKSYNPSKGFGFIACEQLNKEGHSGDVYLHQKHAVTSPFTVGDMVSFTAYLHGGRVQGRDLGEPGSPGGPAAKRLRMDSNAGMRAMGIGMGKDIGALRGIMGGMGAMGGGMGIDVGIGGIGGMCGMAGHMAGGMAALQNGGVDLAAMGGGALGGIAGLGGIGDLGGF